METLHARLEKLSLEAEEFERDDMLHRRLGTQPFAARLPSHDEFPLRPY